jgi:L-ascorbate metabolism protein UlaG (beta-lactamase superfamily)
MIKAHLTGETFIDDVQKARSDPGHLHLWWLGQSGFLVQWQGRHLLLDPYLSDSLTRKYATTDKPHIRMTELVISPECLDFIDVVTSSHNHTDHLDPETIVPLMTVNPKLQLVIPEANRGFVADRLKLMIEQPRGLEAGRSLTLAGFKIHAVPAAHNDLEKDEYGRHKFLGYVIECGPWTLYHSGDTLWYENILGFLGQYSITIALLPINGDEPRRRVAGNLDGKQAAQLAKEIRARLVIPCHYEMFEFNTASPDLFVSTCRELDQPCRVLRAGERWSTREFSTA